MNCPVDGTELRIADRSGVEIDYCPKCRGVWLDRGELERVIERERQVVAAAHEDDESFFREMSGQDRSRGYGIDRHTAERMYSDYKSHRRHKKKRKSFLDELFD